EIALPDAETGLGIELLPESFAFLGADLVSGSPVGFVNKAAGALVAAREDLGIADADPAHLVLADLGVVQRRAPVWRALKHGQVTDGLGDFGDRLHRGGARADHRDALALEADRLLRPVMRMKGLAAEALDPGDARHRRRRQDADRGDQEARAVAAAVLQHDVPAARLLAVTHRGDAAVELDVAAQVELVGDMVEIALGFGLARETLGPVPLVQQFLRKRVGVGIAFRIEAGAGIAVPVPGAANPAAGL